MIYLRAKHLIAMASVLCVTAFLARAEGINPLRVQTRTHWPANVTTVGEAARYILAPSGYRLTLSAPAPREASTIAARSIAPAAAERRLLAIEDALLLIAGPDTRLVVDDRNRLVSFGYIKKRTE